MSKLKLAKYWSASCGGCDVALADLDERILDVAALVDIVLWPVATDFKYSDVEAMEDGEIDITLWNGGIRNSEAAHLAQVLRAKSKLVVSYGSCANFGGIPGLANVSNREEIFSLVYEDMPSTVNPDGVHPQTVTTVNGHTLEIPTFFNQVQPLDHVVDVDYFIPGCPPSTDRIWDLVMVAKDFAETGNLPPKGAVIAGEVALCEDCHRERHDKKVDDIIRIHQLEDDGKTCLLEQGVVCMGPATRTGCGHRCINANMPCRGCLGPLPGVKDQGAKMLSALASIMGLDDEMEMDEEVVERLMAQVVDPLGTFYRFSLGASIIGGRLKSEEGGL
jgi:F420-non-reducing hydrogenase small subunit